MTSHNPHLDIRPSTAQEYMDWYEMDRMPFSVRSLSFYYDGALAGLGGVRFEHGVHYVFSDIKDITVPRATVWRCALEVMKMVREMGIVAYAVQKTDIMTSERFLKRLGFKRDNYNSAHGQEVYRYG